MSNTMRYTGANTNAGCSPALWGNAPWGEVQEGMRDGYFVHEQFNAIAASGSGYLRLAADSGASIAEIATEASGVVRMTTGGTDNNEVSLNYGNSLGVIGKMAAASGKCWFETRFRVGSIADQGLFIGLGEEGLAVANSLTDDTGALASKDYVGFRILTADSDGLDCVHRTASGSEVVVMEADSNPVTAAVLTASTWVKVGLYFDDSACYWFINGQKVSTTGVLDTATSFPTGEELTFTALLKTGEGVTKTLDLDWWRFLQAI